MTEGELKKRILWEGKPFLDLEAEFQPIMQLHYQNIEIHPDPTCEHYVKSEFVNTLLDEAAKEFPLKRLEQTQEDIRALESVENHILIWFKKWLPH